MRIRINELRRIIRSVILEGEEERVYDDTVMPGEEADDELLAEPDLTDQNDRDEYIQSKAELRSKKKKARLRSRDETDESMDEWHVEWNVDENSVAGGGIAGHVGPAWGPVQPPKPMKSRNAMGGKKRKKQPLDEYDE